MKNLDKLLGEDEPKANWRTITLGDIASNFTESFRFIWKSPLFKSFVLMMFFWNMSSINQNHPTVTHYFSILKNFSPEQFGLVISLFQGFGFIGLFLAGPCYQKWGFLNAFVGATLWLAAFTSLSLLFFNSPYVLAFGIAFSKIGSSVFSTGTFYIRQTHVPRARMGGVNACLRMLFMLATPISCFIQPILVEHFGSLTSFVFGALCLWATSYFALKVAKSYSDSKLVKEGVDNINPTLAA
ncbi:MFS transporter [bacterium]|nr:MFS transporter [bacterium]